MAIKKEEFVSQLERAPTILGKLPVTASIVGHLAAELKKGTPKWWAPVQKAWEKRRFVAWRDAWSLFVTCLHFEALNNEKSPLVPFLPSCGGTAEADISQALEEFLAEPPPTFLSNLRTGRRAVYGSPFAQLWTEPAAVFFEYKRAMPYYLVQLRAGAGLDLVADHVHGVKYLEAKRILARIGLDRRPILVEDILQRRWLTAGIMPDNLESIQALDKAIEIYLERKREDVNYVQLVRGPTLLGPQFFAKNIPVDDDRGLLMFTNSVTSRMPEAIYEKFKADMAALLAPWGNRGLWVEVDTVRGELYSSTIQLRVHRPLGKGLADKVIGVFDLGSNKTERRGKEAAAFLKA